MNGRVRRLAMIKMEISHLSLRDHPDDIERWNREAKQSVKVKKQFYVYIMTNWNRTVLYTGVTSNLTARAFQHKAKVIPGFTDHYNVRMLVYYEECADAETAIAREKQIKGGSRKKKIKLINSVNPEWKDLYEGF